jgi:hypothetical protein
MSVFPYSSSSPIALYIFGDHPYVSHLPSNKRRVPSSLISWTHNNYHPPHRHLTNDELLDDTSMAATTSSDVPSCEGVDDVAMAM